MIPVKKKSQKEILESIANIPLVVPQYTFPVYSNTGFNLLGLALTAATNVTSSYADLIHRDIFKPLKMKSSFNVTAENAHRIAVPSFHPETAVRSVLLSRESSADLMMPRPDRIWT